MANADGTVAPEKKLIPYDCYWIIINKIKTV